MKYAIVLAGLLAALVADARAGETVTVEIRKFAFTPKEITIAPGAHVVWVNRDETPHTATATDKAFASPAMDTGDRYEHAFPAPGDYPYFCALHPFMTGVIHVRSAAGRNPTARR